MCYSVFGIAPIVAIAAVAGAQPVPGRDLLEFPIGTIAEAPPLATIARDGLWNPALILLSPRERGRIVASALEASSEQGVTSQMVALALPLGPQFTVGLSAVRSGISDLPRTDSDPQTVGSDIPYGALLVSAMVARRMGDNMDAGIAVRFQRGEFDVNVRNAMIVDAGILIDSVGVRDLRIGVSTFLFPTGIGAGRNADMRLSIAADMRVVGLTEEEQLRAGYGVAYARSVGTDEYFSLSGRLQVLELNFGLRRTLAHGSESRRPRLGIGLRSGGMTVGLAREENADGIAPTYQVVVTSTFRR